MIKKIGILIIVVIAVYFLFFRKKKSENVVHGTGLLKPDETDQDTGKTDETPQASSGEETPQETPVEVESLIVDGKSLPIIGYTREAEGKTIVFIPKSYIKELVPSYVRGTVSQTFDKQIKINTGKYAGNWKVVYVYLNSTSEQAYIYIDAPWMG